MKLRVRRKQTELNAELFNPPLQIPKCVLNITIRPEGYIGEIRTHQNNPITQVIHAGMYIIYYEDGSKGIVSKADFDNHFELTESSNYKTNYMFLYMAGFKKCTSPRHRWLSSKVIECTKNQINDVIEDLRKEVTSGDQDYFELRSIHKVNL